MTNQQSVRVCNRVSAGDLELNVRGSSAISALTRRPEDDRGFRREHIEAFIASLLEANPRKRMRAPRVPRVPVPVVRADE